jgi:hypothetical protein
LSFLASEPLLKEAGLKQLGTLPKMPLPKKNMNKMGNKIGKRRGNIQGIQLVQLSQNIVKSLLTFSLIGIKDFEY